MFYFFLWSDARERYMFELKASFEAHGASAFRELQLIFKNR